MSARVSREQPRDKGKEEGEEETEQEEAAIEWEGDWSSWDCDRPWWSVGGDVAIQNSEKGREQGERGRVACAGVRVSSLWANGRVGGTAGPGGIDVSTQCCSLAH